MASADAVRRASPPPDVLDAFGLDGTPSPLPGGRGTSWRVGTAVLKPVDPTVHAWQAEAVRTIRGEGFRLPAVLRTRSGRSTHRGWGATAYVSGRSSEDGPVDWARVIDAARAFHRATAPLPCPPWLSARDDPWARADKATWDGHRVDVTSPLRDLVAAVSDALAPLGEDQLIHADLTGNVLLAPGEQPAIIDFSPYRRPAAYAVGIIAADALTWHDATGFLLQRNAIDVSAVARGLLFRMLTTHEFQTMHPEPARLDDEVSRYRRAVREIGLA